MYFKQLREKISSLFGTKKADVAKDEIASEKEEPDTRMFLELVSKLELRIKELFEFELLQLYYAPHAFGSGQVVYRIKDINVQVHFDGRDKTVTIDYSYPHAKFPSDGWEETTTYSIDRFWATGIRDIVEKSKTPALP